MAQAEAAGERAAVSPPAPLTVIDLAREAATFTPGTRSRVLAGVNDSVVKFSVFEGEGHWHAHPDTDECFIVLEGELVVEIFEGDTLHVGPGQLVTIPAGAAHRPSAAARTVLLCLKRGEGATQFYELVPPAPPAR